MVSDDRQSDECVVAVAMSGGVDSSVAAAMLIEQGYEVIGVTMCLVRAFAEQSSDGCCSLQSVKDAKSVAEKLGIRHVVLPLHETFERLVIEDFIEEYRRGHTPNPCIRCNRFIKFDALLDWAHSVGAEWIATGHYARIEQDTQSGRWLLVRGRDRAKDQSYALYALTQAQLKHILFPTGELTKSETRKRAADLRLEVAGKRESQEICFVQGKSYTAYLEAKAPELVHPGPVVDVDGNVLGEHRGIAFYTIGQRKRLGVYAARPLYVLEVDAETNTVVVGEEKYLYKTKLIAKNVNLISLEKLPDGLAVTAKVRYNTRDSKAVARTLSEDLIEVEFEEPQRAITPGQAVVLYQGDVVVGGGTIADAREAEEAYRSIGLAASRNRIAGS